MRWYSVHSALDEGGILDNMLELCKKMEDTEWKHGRGEKESVFEGLCSLHMCSKAMKTSSKNLFVCSHSMPAVCLQGRVISRSFALVQQIGGESTPACMLMQSPVDVDEAATTADLKTGDSVHWLRDDYYR